MTEFQASQLAPGDTVVFRGKGYKFLGLDEEGDLNVEPAPTCLYRAQCSLPANRVAVKTDPYEYG